MVVDANLYQDVTETEIVDADVDVIPVLFSEEITAVYGLSYFLYSVADVAAILLAATDVDAAATTAVSGLSFFSSSAADVAVTHLAAMDADVVTIVVDAMTAAVNKKFLRTDFSVLFSFSE